MLVVTLVRTRTATRPAVIRARTTGDGAKSGDPYLDLAERLQAAYEAALEDQQKTDDSFDPADHPHAPAGSSEGGQFTAKPGGGGKAESELGPKPTSVKAKGTKQGLHELLSSGHAFTKKDLLDIMGPDHKEVTLNTWLHKFKSEKFAGGYGALNIKKLPNGAYQVVKSDGALAGPNPLPAVTGPAVAVKTEKPPAMAKGKA